MLSLLRVQVQSLVRELIAHKLHGAAKKKREGGEKKEIKAETFPSLKEEIDIQAQEGKSPKQDESKQIGIKTCN